MGHLLTAGKTPQPTREEQLEKRRAFRRGVTDMFVNVPRGGEAFESSLAELMKGVNKRADQLYPLPQITRRRVLRDPEGWCGPVQGLSLYFTTDDLGRLAYLFAESEAHSYLVEQPARLYECSWLTISPRRWDCWKDLQTNHFETVEDNS